MTVEDPPARAEVVFSGSVPHVDEPFIAPVVATLERVGSDRSGAIGAGGRGMGIPGRASALAVTRG